MLCKFYLLPFIFEISTKVTTVGGHFSHASLNTGG